MDEVTLVDDMEIDPVADNKAEVHVKITSKAESGDKDGSEAKTKNGSRNQRYDNSAAKRAGSDAGLTSVIMMYSPDIPTVSGGYGEGDSGSKMANYYTLIEIEESVKCIVSTALFFMVLVAFLLVAVLLNPEM
jgi:hypothetical protein